MLLPLLRLFGRQTLINRGKLGLLHRLAPPESFSSRRFTTDFFDFRYSGDLSNYIDWRVYMTGSYEPEALSLLGDMAAVLRRHRRAVHYVDVGANVGNHALYMSRHADQVTAFEPFARVAAEIEQKVSDNGLTNLRLFPFALGEFDAELPLQTDGDNNLGTASLVADRAAPERQVPVGTVSVRVGDDVFEESGLAPIDLLKIDVEGFEASVFAGLRRRILADRPVILSEISGRDRSGFGTAEAFHAALYPDHTVYSLGTSRGRYVLSDFTLDAGDVLCVPNELLPLTGN